MKRYFRYFQLLLVLGLGLALVFTGYYSVTREGTISLSKATRATARITKAFESIEEGENGKLTFFAFSLAGVPDTFLLRKFGENYSELKQALRVGDEVTVYYRPVTSVSVRNIDVYQVEKGRQLIKPLAEHHSSSKVVGWVIGLLGLWMMVFGSRQVLKPDEPTPRA
jgi:hypothetical protein